MKPIAEVLLDTLIELTNAVMFNQDVDMAMKKARAAISRALTEGLR